MVRGRHRRMRTLATHISATGEMTPDDERRARNRARQKRCRELQRQRKAGYWVVIDGAVLNWLVYYRWLADADTDDPKKVSAAISALLTTSSQR